MARKGKRLIQNSQGESGNGLWVDFDNLENLYKLHGKKAVIDNLVRAMSRIMGESLAIVFDQRRGSGKTKRRGEKKRTMTVSVSGSMLDKLDKFCKKRDLSRSEVVETLLMYLGKEMR